MWISSISERISRRCEGRLATLSACMAVQLLLSIVLGLNLDPGGESFVLAFTLMGCAAMSITVFTMPQANRICIITLCVAAAIMTTGAWINLLGYTHDSFTLASPDFHAEDPFDSHRDFEYARYMLLEHQRPVLYSGNLSYPLMVCGLFYMFGVNIIWPIALNMGFSLGTIVLTGAICSKLMPEYGRRNMAMSGMIMAAAISGILMHGTLLLKDAPAIFGTALFSYSMALTLRGQFNTRAICTAVFAILVLIFSRPMLGWFLLMGVVLIAVRGYLRTHSLKSLSAGIFYALLIMALLGIAQTLVGIQPNTDALTGDNKNFSQSFFLLPTVQSYGHLVDGYFHWSLWRRLLYLPFVCAVQYFPPFPWNFTRDLWMGNFYWFAHIPIGWYAVGGLTIGYYIFCWWRKRSLWRLNVWALWFLLCYMGIGFYTAGSIPRYYLPFIPCAIPLASSLIAQCRALIVSRRAVAIYGVVYLALLGIGLTAAYFFLHT